MNHVFTLEEQNDRKILTYRKDPQETIRYQERILCLRMKRHTAGLKEEEDGLVYHLDWNQVRETAWMQMHSREAVLERIEALQQLLEDTEEALLDPDRWLWDPEQLIYDRQNRSLRGIYVPDRRFSSSASDFLASWAAALLQNCLRTEAYEEDWILFVYRFYLAVSAIQRGEQTLSGFLVQERGPRPEAKEGFSPPALLENSWLEEEEDPDEAEHPKPTFWQKIRTFFCEEEERSLRFE